MSKLGVLPILCVLLLAFQKVFCGNEFTKNKDVSESSLSRPTGDVKIVNGDFFKSVWQNAKQRRHVKSVGDSANKVKREPMPQTKPMFECRDRVMTLIVKHEDVRAIQIYGPTRKLLDLGGLAAFCGVSFKNSRTDLRLLFNSDSCYVKQEAAEYALSLRWYDTDMVLSCPITATPPSVTCKKNGMELAVAGEGTADELLVALNGEWAPLLYVATQCWHREPSNQGELTFSVPYTSCGVNFRDGHFILDVRSVDKTMTLFCPYEPKPVFSVEEPWMAKPLPEEQHSLHLKPPTAFPTKALAGHLKHEQRLPVAQQDRKASKPFITYPVQPRGHWLHRMPSIPKLFPGSFNLAVNFPFSLPMPTPPLPLTDDFTDPVVTSTPVTPPTTLPTIPPTTLPTIPPTPLSTLPLTPPPTNISTPTDSTSPQPQQLTPSVEVLQPVPVTVAPESQTYPYMQYPYFQNLASTPSDPNYSPFQEYEQSWAPVQGTKRDQPFESVQDYSFHRPHRPLNAPLPNFSQFLPPGFCTCPYYNHQLRIVPQMSQSSVANHPPRFQDQMPAITPLVPDTPVANPMRGQSAKQPTSSISYTDQESGTPLFQPFQYQPYYYQGSYTHQGSTATPSFSPSLLPENMQTQRRPYRPYPAFQAVRPFQPQYYQKQSQPSVPIQQPGSTTHRPQESRPMMPGSSKSSGYLQHTGGNRFVNPQWGSFVKAPGPEISSHSQYQPIQFPRYTNPQLRAAVYSADGSPKNSPSSPPKGAFQPRSLVSASSPEVPNVAVTHPFESSTPTQKSQPHMPQFFSVKGQANVSQLPYSQGPSVRNLQNPFSQRPSELDNHNPQNDTLLQYQSYRQASLLKDVSVSPHFRPVFHQGLQ